MAERQVYLFEGKDRELSGRVSFGINEENSFTFEDGGLPPGIEEAYVSMPLERLNFRVLDLELSDIDKIKEVLSFELEGLILGPPEDIVSDAVVIGGADGKKKVLAVYAGKSVLKALLEGLGRLNIDPRVVTSLDLGSALEGSAEELSQGLMKQKTVEGDERVFRALREMERYSVNLRSGELAYTKETEKAKRSLKLAAVLAALVLVFLSADMALRTVSLRRESARLKRQIESVYSDMFPSEKLQGTEGLSMKMESRLKEMKGKEALLRGVSPLELMYMLRGIKLNLSDITLDGGLITLRGEAPSLSQVQDIKARLEGLFNEVGISEVGQSVKGKVPFTITAKEAEN